MAEAVDLHAGLEAYLRADAALAMLAPGGVHFDVGPAGETRPFVLYRVQAGERVTTHDRGGFEQIRYSVTGVVPPLETTAGRHSRGAEAAAIARRLGVLLEGARFAAAGWTVTRCEIDPHFGPIALKEVDGDRVWQHRGRIWDVWATPT